MSNLQMGQVLLLESSHLSIQSVWKKCKQGIVLTTSPSSYSIWHTIHFLLDSSSYLFRNSRFIFLSGKLYINLNYSKLRLNYSLRCNIAGSLLTVTTTSTTISLHLSLLHNHFSENGLIFIFTALSVIHTQL